MLTRPQPFGLISSVKKNVVSSVCQGLDSCHPAHLTCDIKGNLNRKDACPSQWVPGDLKPCLGRS